jgi:hypothetical protein
MQDYLTIGPVPSNECCAQLGAENYTQQALMECGRFADQIRRHYPEPDGGYIAVKRFDHEFGSYYECVAVFDDIEWEATEWAYRVESDPLGVLADWEEKTLND